jgi:molybdenum cofactor guanylyltransferase
LIILRSLERLAQKWIPVSRRNGWLAPGRRAAYHSRMAPNVACVVLAGGEGRRIGGEKPLRRLGGVTLLDRALAFAATQSDLVAVSLRTTDQVEAPQGLPILLDAPDIPGPLAGLAAGLAYAREQGRPAVLTLPCDTPRLPDDLAARLAERLIDGVGVVLAESGGQLHPVCGLWRVTCADALPGYVAQGRRSLWGFAKTVGMVQVEWPMTPYDPFVNVNTPEDLAALEDEQLNG